MASDSEDSKEKIKRKNHYVPALHLKRFTASGKDDDVLWVLDLQLEKQWRASARGTGFESFLYTVKLPGYSPNYFENWLANVVEGPADRILDWIRDHKQVPEGEEFGRLMVYVAIQTVRIPALRKSISQFLDDSGKSMLRMLLGTPERWAAHVEKLRAAGKTLPKEADYDSLKKFIDSDDFQIEATPELFVKNIIELSKAIVPYLLERTWSLWIAKEGTGEFVCSDRPVALNSLRPLPPWTGPGHALKGTVITIPISSQMALEGRFEGESRVERADSKMIAVINGCTVRSAERFIYSINEDFLWSSIRAQKLLRKDALLREYKEARSRA